MCKPAVGFYFRSCREVTKNYDSRSRGAWRRGRRGARWRQGCGKNLYISSCFIAPFTGKQVHGYIKLLKLFESHQDESKGPLTSSVDESSSKQR